MAFSNFYQHQCPVISYEFFPPREKSELENTKSLIRKIANLNPDFMSVTDGAFAGTRDRTFELVTFINDDLNVCAVSHVTCMGRSKNEIESLVKSFLQKGISHLLTVRGDASNAGSIVAPEDGFSCARDLVRFIKKAGDFSIAVAGYPETHRDALSSQTDLDYLKEKVVAGAEVVITQLFFDEVLYFRFLERARSNGINVPIVPGIMPISNVKQLKNFVVRCGASIPTKLNSRLQELESNPTAVIDYGIEYTQRFCENLLRGGAPGLHFFTLNKSSQIEKIVTGLGFNRKRD